MTPCKRIVTFFRLKRYYARRIHTLRQQLRDIDPSFDIMAPPSWPTL